MTKLPSLSLSKKYSDKIAYSFDECLDVLRFCTKIKEVILQIKILGV